MPVSKTIGVRLVTFDLLHTLITPRFPIHVQYAQVFKPYLGTLDSEIIKREFKIALRQVQKERPAYLNGTQQWWGEVIRRTALGAGADPRRVQSSLEKMVSRLLHRFSSKEGYRAFDDAIPTLRYLRECLNISTAAVSNSDIRMRRVIQDLGLESCFNTVVLSQEVGVEKPCRRIFHRCIDDINREMAAGAESTSEIELLEPQDCLHIGDEIESDYFGALEAGMRVLLLRRPGNDNMRDEEEFKGLDVIESLTDVEKMFKAERS